MPETIVIHTASPRDISLEECEQIAESVRGLSPDFEVRVEGHERTGLGVTWFEVLRISLLGGVFGLGKLFAEETAKKIADIFVDWARERIKERKNKSKRPVCVAIYGPDGIIKSVVVKNATDEPEDRTEQDQRTARSVSAPKVVEDPTPTVKTATCEGRHLCPSCREVKDCALGFCGVVGEVKCDSCLYLEEYGAKATPIIEKAIAVASKLHDASSRLARFLPDNGPQPWATKEEARAWMNESNHALEELDNALNRIHLRLKARQRPRV
jgi:hypothetical protein